MTAQDGYAAGSNRTEQGDVITRIGGQLDIVTTEGGTGVTLDGTPVTPGDVLSGVTASAAELNLNDGAVAGTSVASKTLALGANKNTDILALPVSGLKIGAGAGTAVTASAAELNTLTGITATVAELNETDNKTSRVQSTVAVAGESGNAIAVTVTLKDAAGVAIVGARPVRCWLSSSATTGAIASDDSITVTATTGLLIEEEVDDLKFAAITDVNGVLVLSVAHAGDSTGKYLWIDFPGQAPLVSAIIDLA